MKAELGASEIPLTFLSCAGLIWSTRGDPAAISPLAVRAAIVCAPLQIDLYAGLKWNDSYQIFDLFYLVPSSVSDPDPHKDMPPGGKKA